MNEKKEENTFSLWRNAFAKLGKEQWPWARFI